MLVPGPRTVTNESDARRCMAAAAAAEMSLYGWCRANNVSSSVLYRWRQKLDRLVPCSSPRLVELCAPPAVCAASATAAAHRPTAQTVPSHGAARYSLAVNDVTIVVRDDFADATLARLLRLVRAC